MLAGGCADNRVRLWDVDTGKCLQVLSGHTAGVFSVAFSPQGGTLASGSLDGTIRVWHLEDGMCKSTLRVPRPYEGVNLAGATGLTEAQRSSLRELGAVSPDDDR